MSDGIAWAPSLAETGGPQWSNNAERCGLTRQGRTGQHNRDKASLPHDQC
jgi:hypothetical protein